MIFDAFYPGEMIFYALACWAAWMTGRSIAGTWRTMASGLLYSVPLAMAVRFIHFALYEGPFLSLTHFVADLIVMAIIVLIAFQYTRTNQMVSQYGWLYEKASPLSWRNRA
ncbi:MAG: DUF6867 family protein [Notoacmeibacter sp.]